MSDHDGGVPKSIIRGGLRAATAAASCLLAVVVLSLMSSTRALAEDLIQVRFVEGIDVDPPTDPLTPALLADVDGIVRLFTLSDAELDELRAQGQTASGESLPDLKMWFEITLAAGTDAAQFLQDLRALPTVDEAQFAPVPLPLPAVTPDFTGLQGYRGPATDGIDAIFSATLTGGNGAGVTIYDVEYSWNQTHEDLSKANGLALLLDSGDAAVDPFASTNHGTAVLGELIADNDTKGVTGVSWGADIGLAPANTVNLGYNPANAILLAVADGSPGDVILIEQQTGVCGLPGPCSNNCGPSEWTQSVFDAIQTAVANRFVVVEAAGNGGVDLDQAACGTTFDRTVRDSGAILVGAGGHPGGGSDRERLGFSSYGSRVDLQGWGSGVMTTGYGTYYTNADDPTNADFFYRSTFGGTSSASPIVAGAAANLQGIAKDLFGTPLLSFQLRSLLRDTGSPQLGTTAEHIGPRPDLSAAIGELTLGAIDLFFIVDLSGSFADDLPVFQAQAPGIIDTIKAMNANVKFGVGRFEDYPITPFGSLADGDTAYERVIDLTFDTDAVKAVIAGLTTRFGDDEPQSQLAALFQAASGAGQVIPGYPEADIPAGQQANFRNGATKLFLLWTDAAFHLPGDPGGPIPYPGPSFADTVAAIETLDPPMVVGISIEPHGGLADLEQMAIATNSLAPASGVDCDGDGIPDIAEGEPLVCLLSSFGAGIGEAVVSIVEGAVEAARPVAECQDVTTTTDSGVCTADVSVDNGSYDPDGGSVSFTQSPPSPYPLGETLVTLRVADETGLTDTCLATVTVVDDEPPMPSCNAPSTIIPPDAPISIVATATDNCGIASIEITEYDCYMINGAGKRVDKTGSCSVSIAGDTITILDSGGVGDHITWTVVATDESGNVTDVGCEVEVVNPGHGH